MRLSEGTDDAKNRVTTAAEVLRWTWSISLALAALAAIRGDFTTAAVGGFAWVTSIIAGALCAGAARLLGEGEPPAGDELLSGEEQT